MFYEMLAYKMVDWKWQDESSDSHLRSNRKEEKQWVMQISDDQIGDGKQEQGRCRMGLDYKLARNGGKVIVHRSRNAWRDE